MTTLLVAVADALLTVRSKDGWEAEERLRGSTLQCVAVDPRRPERIYAGTAEAGLWLSDDGGASWRQAGEGIGPGNVTAVAVSALEEGLSYAGTEPSAVFRSEDGGRTWRELEGLDELPSSGTWSFPPRPWTHHVRWIGTDPTREGALFVAIEAGALVHSLDGGQTWEDRVPGGPYDTHTLGLHARASGRLWSAAGDGYFESDDGGATWRRPREGLAHGYVWGLALDSGDPETVLVSAAPSPGAAHNASRGLSFVYRRQGGEVWHRVSEGLPAPEGTSASVLAAHPEDASTFFAANNHGLYVSMDTGLSWERLDVPWPERFGRHRVAGLAVAA